MTYEYIMKMEQRVKFIIESYILESSVIYQIFLNFNFYIKGGVNVNIKDTTFRI